MEGGGGGQPSRDKENAILGRKEWVEMKGQAWEGRKGKQSFVEQDFSKKIFLDVELRKPD